jgi:hypothetical protein
MQESISKDKNKLKIFSSLLIIVLLIMGVSFAIFQNFARQSRTNNLGATNCFSVTFEGVNNAINLANDYPIPDSEGLERNPYTFKVTNNCNQYLSLSIGVETLSTSEIPSNLIKGVIVKNDETPTSAFILSSGKTMEAQNGGTAYELLSEGLGAKVSKTYDLRLWFDESMTKEQGASKKYQGKVIVGASADVQGSRNLREAILADNEVKTPLTTPGSEISAHTLDDVSIATSFLSDESQAYYVTYGTGWTTNGSNFNLTGVSVTNSTYANSYSSLVGKYLVSNIIHNAGSTTAGTKVTTNDLGSIYYVVSATSSSFTYKVLGSVKNITEALLARTEDDDGISYYFRGAVKNNYVEFANKCWRIVRISGDKTVKLVLHNDNTSNVSNPCSSSSNSTTSAFARYSGTSYVSQFNEISDDNAGIGFMYGTPYSTSYAETHENINKSTILTSLEKWYNNNLLTYESKIADTVWCNDKSIVTDLTYDPWGWNPTGLGYGENVTYYNPTKRLVNGGGSTGGTGPSLKCNGTLSKVTTKIGLLSADEVAFAGYAYNLIGAGSYLQENATDDYWWLLSPDSDLGNMPCVWLVIDGMLLNDSVSDEIGVRPAISLSPSITVIGSGTSEEPYVVQ